MGYCDPPADGTGASRLVISSPPVSSVNNRAATVILGMTVGGGSAVNGQFLDRGSRYDYDEWARLGSPQFDDSPDSWDWENFGPAFEKASLTTIPANVSIIPNGFAVFLSDRAER